MRVGTDAAIMKPVSDTAQAGADAGIVPAPAAAAAPRQAGAAPAVQDEPATAAELTTPMEAFIGTTGMEAEADAEDAVIAPAQAAGDEAPAPGAAPANENAASRALPAMTITAASPAGAGKEDDACA